MALWTHNKHTHTWRNSWAWTHWVLIICSSSSSSLSHNAFAQVADAETLPEVFNKTPVKCKLESFIVSCRGARLTRWRSCEVLTLISVTFSATFSPDHRFQPSGEQVLMCHWEYFQAKMPGKHGQGRDNDSIRRCIISGKNDKPRKDTRAHSAA